MKQSHKSLFLLFLIVAALPHRAVAAQAEQPLTFSDRLRSLQSKATQSLKSAGSILKQKGTCLINYESCTPRDKIAISTAFGFIMGYGFKFQSLIDRILIKFNINPRVGLTIPLRDIIITSLALSIAQEAGLTGPLMMSKGAGLLGSFFHNYSIAPDRQLFLAAHRALFQAQPALEKILFLLIIASEAFSVLQEAMYAVRYEKKSPLVSIARYLKMNAQCIWKESYCRPKENAEMRRLGLYFWLGYLQGRGARAIKAPFLRYWTTHGSSSPGGGGGHLLGTAT